MMQSAYTWTARARRSAAIFRGRRQAGTGPATAHSEREAHGGELANSSRVLAHDDEHAAQKWYDQPVGDQAAHAENLISVVQAPSRACATAGGPLSAAWRGARGALSRRGPEYTLETA